METERVSYMHQPSPRRLEHRTISQMLDKRAAEHAQKEAIILYDEQRQRHCLTFGQFQRQSQSLAAALLAKGLSRGDRVALLLPNSLEFAVSFMALNRIGANVVVIPQGGSAEYIKGVLVQLKCVGLLCYVNEDETKRKALMDAIHDMKKTGLIGGDGESVMKCLVTLGAQVKWEALMGLVHQYEELLSSQQPKDMNWLEKTEQKVQFDDPAVVMLSSGSTGIPKACQFTNQSVVVALDSVCAVLNFTCKSKRFSCSPFSWVPGLGGICAVASVGATCVSLPPALLLKDTATEFILSVVSSERCTSGSLSPSFIYDVVNNSSLLKKFDLGCFENASTGGQMLSRDLVSNFLNLFTNLVLNFGYGATETFAFVSNSTCNKENVTSSEEYGWMVIAPNFEVKVVDPNGRVLPVCTTGEVIVRGPAIFQEYLEDSQATSSSKSRTRWWSSGDVGVMDDKGRIKIYGRTGDAINRATDTVYPAEFEVDIAKSPLVAKVAVVGVPDQRLYEEVCACVILKDHARPESQKVELVEWYKKMWPENADGSSWKPGYTIYLKEFPLTRTMKPDRRALRKMAVEKLGLEEEKGK